MSRYQSLYELLLRGASLHGAYLELGWELSRLPDDLERDAELRQVLDRVRAIHTLNVASAFYQKAMKGSVSAQIFWLTHNRPLGWAAPPGTEPERKPDHPLDPLDSLSDEDLAYFARILGIPVPEELTADISS